MSVKKLNKFQQKVLDSEGNVLVNASAGSGKTSTMIEKIMQLVCQGVNIRNILVITFTVAAASEMKQKLIKEIYARARANSANYSVLLKQLDNIPFANICTIDSFCLNIFQKYFALINRDPSCSMLDPDEFTAIINGIIDSVCEEYINAQDEEFLLLAKHFSESRRLDTLKKAIITLYDFIISQEDFEKYNQEVLLSKNSHQKIMDYFIAYFDKRVATLIEDTAHYIRLPFDDSQEIKKARYIYQELSKLDAKKDCANAFNNLIILCETEKPKLNKSPLKDEINAYYGKLKDIKEEFEKYYLLLKYPKAVKHKEKLIEIVLKVQNDYFEYKSKRNLVDFSDLKHYTLKILKNDKARQEIKNSIDYIFIDEYQDTDYLQESMLKAISKDDNVFVVGDMKQSIYRFRYAEPKIFYTRMHEYDNLKTGTNIPLSTNYRSDKRILNFINEICSEIITEDFCNIDYKNGSMLEAGIDFKKVSNEPSCAIYTYINSKSKEARKGYFSVKDEILNSQVDTESAFVAGKIKELVSSVVICTPSGEERKLQYKDIALLSSRRSAFANILIELNKAQIPYNYDDNDKTKDIDPKLETLIDFLRILHNAEQDIPLANVLTSNMFDFKMSELLRIQKENPQFTFSQAFFSYDLDDQLRKKVDRFLDILELYRLKSSYMKVSDLLVDVMSLGFDAYLLSQGKHTIERINTFIQYIAERKENDSVDEFIYFFDNNYKGHKVNTDNDAVTLTTIHKSKGLEYPVVFLVGADKSINMNNNKEKFYTDKELGLAVKSFDDDKYKVEDNFETEVFKLKAKTEERLELARLLYVGMTRAQNHLIITGSVPKKEVAKSPFTANSFMDFLLYVKQRNGKFASYFNEIELKEDLHQVAEASLEKVEKEVINLDILDKKYPYYESTISCAKYSVTELMDLSYEQGKVKKLFDYVEADTGINYHIILQHIDYGAIKKEEIIGEISKLVEENIISIEQANSVDVSVLEKVMNSKIMDLARNNKTLREQPFMLYTNSIDGITLFDDKVLIQGVIDLIIFDEKATLVDFKTSFGNPNYLKEKYSKQLDLYAKAVEEIMGYKVGRKVIYNILKGFTVEL